MTHDTQDLVTRLREMTPAKKLFLIGAALFLLRTAAGILIAMQDGIEATGPVISTNGIMILAIGMHLFSDSRAAMEKEQGE